MDSDRLKVDIKMIVTDEQGKPTLESYLVQHNMKLEDVIRCEGALLLAFQSLLNNGEHL